MRPDPFKPTFGASPPLLAGREELIEMFVDGLEAEPGGLERATIYTGLRGSGKTVLLNAIEQEAKALGWLVVSETATPGFLDRMTREHLPALLIRHDKETVRRHLSGVSLPVVGGGFTWTTEDIHQAVPGLRSQIALLTDVLAEHETGLLISLDEVHRRQFVELDELGAALSHAVREGRNIAFVAAGLPEAVNEVLQDPGLTFLRRADRYQIGAVDRDDVLQALKQPIERNERTIGEGALEVMVDGTAGYPFLIQLVGSRSWRVHPNEHEITVEDAVQGVEAAHRRMGALVHEPSLRAITDVGRSFLVAMAKDDGPSSMGDIAQRLDVDSTYAGQYRLRLINAELIRPAGYGKVDFALPYLREYLREHVTSIM